MSAHPAMIRGDHTITEDGEFDGMVQGDVTVAAGVKVTLRGMIGGDLVIEPGAAVRLGAMVGGQTVNHGGTIIP